MKKPLTAFACGAVAWGVLLAAPAISLGSQSPQTAPDNTSANRDTNSPTADNAKNSQSDTQIMAHIRREIVKDKSLSTDSHNVKIICRHGKVTLRGPVHTDDEKKTILAYASKYAGDGNVTDEITVKGDSK
jgi:hyperosmotically inducible periplasmic protein